MYSLRCLMGGDRRKGRIVSETVAQQCVRGCARPCRCEECKAAPETQHPPIPTPAKEGLLCARCAGRLEGWLTDILDDTLRLDVRKVQAGDVEKGKHQKISGSPALVRLDVAALTDRRYVTALSEEGETYEENQSDNPILSIPFTVCSWAQLLTEEHDIRSPVAYMAQAVSVLRSWWTTLVEELWIDDFYNDMEKIRRLLNNAHGVERARPIGHCLSVYEVDGQMQSCERPIYAHLGDTVLKCGRCGRIYEGADRARLIVSEELTAG